MIEYKCMDFPRARAEGLEPPWWEEWPDVFTNYDDEYRWGIWLVNADGTSEFLECDGGEPEDNCFYRDGAWIAPALNKAYESGYKDGAAEALGLESK